MGEEAKSAWILCAGRLQALDSFGEVAWHLFFFFFSCFFYFLVLTWAFRRPLKGLT